MLPPLALSLFSLVVRIPPPSLRPAYPQKYAAAHRICMQEDEPHARLTLVRHGQSEWNLANRFTGWMDVDLTERGITEARAAGRLLAAAGEQHDLVCTSCLRRAIRTACLVLSGTDQCWVPMVKDWRLNEQHSGALTGYNKRELAEEHGVEQVMAWRRTYDCPPPQMPTDNPLQRFIADERYRATDGIITHVPVSESLEMTSARVQSLWEDTLKPALKEGKNVLVVSHGNTLRALVKLVDGVSEEDSFHLDLPTACPVIYELDADLKPYTGIPEGFWGESDAPRYGRFLMSEKKVRQAQDAMRQQCVKNIAVSTVNAHTNNPDDDISICDAWTAPSSSQRLIRDINGVSFNVRETPPSYFALESERIKKQAQQEITSMLATMTKEVNDDARAAVEAEEAGADGDAASEDGDAALQTPAPPALPKCMLIIIRHGYSEYNAENRFTGWADVELSNQGREEARFAGSLLREAGVRRLEKVYASYLKRSIKTAWLMLDEMEMQWVPIEYTWRLNERHYGALQGRPKRKCSEEFGVKQVQRWRRGVRYPPPPWDTNQRAATVDRRYSGIEVPESESLEECTRRLVPFLEEELKPAMRDAIASVEEEERRQAAERLVETSSTASSQPVEQQRGGVAATMSAGSSSSSVADAATATAPAPRPGIPAFVIASSENLIRALVAELEGLDEAEVPLLDIPYATPLVYQFDGDLTPLKSTLAAEPLSKGYYLGDAERIKEVQRDIRESLVTETTKAAKSDASGEAGGKGDVDLSELAATGTDTCFTLDESGGVNWECE